MCGIVFEASFKGIPVNNNILQQFDMQRSRGTQGFGLFDGMENNIVRAANENKILKWLVNYDSDMIMFHHRFPTSTINVKRAAHPFSTKKYFGNTQYVLVHNGTITNHRELRTEHGKLGIKYQSLLKDGTYNDSEALLWDFALTMEGKQDEMKAYGGIAFICVKLVNNKIEKLHFGRNYSRPLNMEYTKDGLALSSEGRGTSVKEHTLYTFNYQLKRMTKKPFQVPSWSGKTNYRSWEDDTPLSGFGNNPCYQNNWDRDEEFYDTHYYSNGSWIRKLPPKFEHDYDRDGNPIDCSDGLQKQIDMLSDDYEYSQGVHTPSPGQVDTLVAEYILRCHGNFETAYFLAEADYGDMLDDEADEFTYTDELALMERVLERLESDPEYINETSVSSMWEEIQHA